MKLRGRELYIIAAIVAVVVCAAWFFFFFRPIRSELSDLDAQVTDKQEQLASVQTSIQRLQALKKTSPQAEADIVRLRKLLPAETAQPSFIVELTQSAKASGLLWWSVAPDDVLLGVPFSMQPIEVVFRGYYFDLEDFLYRLESYAEYRNGDFVVSGRMFLVSGLNIELLETDTTSAAIEATVVVNGYMWTPSGTVPGVVPEE